MSYEQNSKTLKLAAELLDDFSKDIVYVGGITTFLYVDVDIADDIHPTYDVDFVLETSKRKDYDLFQEKLRKKGFTHDTSPGAPICRFKYGEELIVDAMPSDESILRFSNSWYEEGIRHKEKVKVGDKEIHIFPLEYFIASKFEAFNGRGKSEPRLSWDLEDIIFILDGIKDFHPQPTSDRLKSFLSEMCSQCLKPQIQEAIAGFLRNNDEKITKVNQRLKMFMSAR